MITLSAYKFLLLAESLKHEVLEEVEGKPYRLNIVGFRNRFARTDYFDDTIAVYFQDNGNWYSYYFEATTLPGKDSMLKPVNAKGTAVLVPGQYQGAYELGLHKGKYQALVQNGSVKVYRDNNKDLVYDLNERTAEEGLFGINIHKASFSARLVGPNSAGCQVIKSSSDFDTFIGLCSEGSKVWGSKFTYTLVEI